ncbi:hypothetical protein [Nocardiopsis lambiniae]|uniref:FUSC family protein n=1 Tax=Nocardiopsis lambiniae TaxID=3075539 RepID=A0ABU2MAL5_9ACTN|nr:hypothetical protein [Nocardiopsis sp. DSM 44743]MDT0329708.1 hypothetical protein [Nocardiopsis sp. DSM 44743]
MPQPPLRDVCDPLLPRPVTEVLRDTPGRLAPAAPGTAPALRYPYLERLLIGLPLCVGIITVVWLLEQASGGLAAWCAALAGAFLYIARPMPDEEPMDSLRFAGVLGLGYFMPWSVWAAGMSAVFGSVTASVGFLHVVLLFFFVLRGGGRVRAGVPRDRCVTVDELEHTERDVLRRVQRLIDEVEEGGRVLAPHYDPTETLISLRAWEWTLADRMRRTSELARRLDEVESAEVRRALHAGTDVVAHAREKDERTVARVEQRLRSVREAVRAHRDLERLGARAHSTDAYADLLAHVEGAREASPTDPVGADDDPGLIAARETLRLRIRDADTAGDWLAKALRAERGERTDRA